MNLSFIIQRINVSLNAARQFESSVESWNRYLLNTFVFFLCVRVRGGGEDSWNGNITHDLSTRLLIYPSKISFLCSGGGGGDRLCVDGCGSG